MVETVVSALAGGGKAPVPSEPPVPEVGMRRFVSAGVITGRALGTVAVTTCGAGMIMGGVSLSYGKLNATPLVGVGIANTSPADPVKPTFSVPPDPKPKPLTCVKLTGLAGRMV